jgi:hypothetical protein
MEEEAGPSNKQVYVQSVTGRSRKFQTTVDAVVAFFAECGKPKSVLNKWGEEPADGRLREVAFVAFKKNKAVEKALALSGNALGGVTVTIGINKEPPKTRGGVKSSARIFVGNLPKAEGGAAKLEPALRELFAPCCRVLFVRFPEGSTHFCHVILEDDTTGAAASAALALDGVELEGQGLRVGAAPANPKQKRAPREPASSASAADGDGERPAKKAHRPVAEWRFDRSAGLTAPRPKSNLDSMPDSL